MSAQCMARPIVIITWRQTICWNAGSCPCVLFLPSGTPHAKLKQPMTRNRIWGWAGISRSPMPWALQRSVLAKARLLQTMPVFRHCWRDLGPPPIACQWTWAEVRVLLGGFLAIWHFCGGTKTKLRPAREHQTGSKPAQRWGAAQESIISRFQYISRSVVKTWNEIVRFHDISRFLT